MPLCSTCKTEESRAGQRTCRLCHNTYMRKNRGRWTPSADQRFKVWAREMAKYALSIGQIQRRPCEILGCGARAQMHHDDYMRPLDVRWLCRPHHSEHHRKEREAPNLSEISVRSATAVDPEVKPTLAPG